MSVIVFTGPTLSAHEVREVIDAECRPPVAQGDVYRAALRAPRAIAIVDGYFECVPAVWHKEILWAMSQGIHVFGSASMGALRAAELVPFGMVGVGAIFEAYRDGAFEDDDEVAVAHGPTGESFCFSSEAMVNIRATMARALAEQIIPAETRDALLRIAKALFYPDRSWPCLLERATVEGVPELERLRAWLPGGRVNQKRDDALAMLRALDAFLAGNPGPKRVSYVFERTLYWEAFVRAAAEPEFEGREADAMVLEELKRDPEALVRAEAAALGWRLALERARRQGHAPSAAEFLDRSTEFCARHGLTDSISLPGWLERNRCDAQNLDRILEMRSAVLDGWRDASVETTAALLDYLRWTGDYGVLLERARALKRP